MTKGGTETSAPDEIDLLAKAEAEFDEMRISEALRSYDEAEAAGCDPDRCAAGRWQCHMLGGNFELAWRESDAIERRGAPDPNRFWDGQDFAGRNVMVRCLHGLGDTVQFTRYVPLIRARARSVTVEAQPSLKRLLQCSGIGERVITWGEAEPPWDQQLEINELPRIFRTTLDSIPEGNGYLKIPHVPPVEPYNGRRPFRVGLVWRASDFNPRRSVPLATLSPVLNLPNVSFVSLQAGPACQELRPWANNIPNLSENSQCVLETAEHIARLNLMISVDTMTAHLAGALGRPTWTLLPYACDWRWMREREDSPWYPSMRLFRQREPGQWEPVVERMATALKALVIAHRNGHASGLSKSD